MDDLEGVELDEDLTELFPDDEEEWLAALEEADEEKAEAWYKDKDADDAYEDMVNE